MLVRLLYASRAAGELDESMVGDILAQSTDQNPAHGITGLLCIHIEGGIFLQAIEGGRNAVNRLYRNMSRDRRHMDLTLLDYSEIEERRFSGWRMGIVDLDKVNVGTVLRYSESAQLDPFSMKGHGALALLEELADSAAIMSPDLS